MALLEVENMSHDFGGLRAVNNYSLRIDPGDQRQVAGVERHGRLGVHVVSQHGGREGNHDHEEEEEEVEPDQPVVVAVDQPEHAVVPQPVHADHDEAHREA